MNSGAIGSPPAPAALTSTFSGARPERDAGSARLRDLERAKIQLVAFVQQRELESRNGSTQPSADSLPPVGIPLVPTLYEYVHSLGSDRPSFQTAMVALKHLASFCVSRGVVYIHDMTLEQQERYVARRCISRNRRGELISNATITRDLSVLKAALGYAWRRGRIAAVPFVLSLPAPSSRRRFITAEEARRLLACCHELYLYRFVLLCLHTLQRPGAIFDLRTSQVDLENDRIDFLPPGATQSNKRRPVVPITSTLHRELTLALPESQSGFVLERRGRPLRSMRKAFAQACAKAGLERVTPYALRHTGATLLAAAGVPMRQIAGVLGHTTQRTTEIYAKHQPEFLREAASNLNQMFATEQAGQTGISPPTRSEAEVLAVASR